MSSHAWCHDIARDAAVRAAEDNRTGPLPTLGEAIDQAGQFMHPEPSQGQKCTERESGLRTERVTLEIKHFDDNDGDSVYRWNWAEMMAQQGLGINETVRVVEDQRESHLAAQRGLIDTLTRQRDASIRERDEAKQHHAWECAKCVALADKVIGLRDRVAELESAVKLAPAANADAVSNPRPISGAGKSAGEETQAASGAAGTEPEAWGFVAMDGVIVHVSTFEPVPGGATVVPLYAAPPPANGWLTEEERKAIAFAADQTPESDFVTSGEGEWVKETLNALLASSSPPEVVPVGKRHENFCRSGDEQHWVRGWNECRERFLADLAAAGVTVKEVSDG